MTPAQVAHIMPPLPETPYQLYYEWPDDEDGYGGSEVVDGDAYTAEQMKAYARAAVEAALRDAPPQASQPTQDAVDAERWRAFLSTRPANTHSAINQAIDEAHGIGAAQKGKP